MENQILIPGVKNHQVHEYSCQRQCGFSCKKVKIGFQPFLPVLQKQIQQVFDECSEKIKNISRLKFSMSYISRYLADILTDGCDNIVDTC